MPLTDDFQGERERQIETYYIEYPMELIKQFAETNFKVCCCISPREF